MTDKKEAKCAVQNIVLASPSTQKNTVQRQLLRKHGQKGQNKLGRTNTWTLGRLALAIPRWEPISFSQEYHSGQQTIPLSPEVGDGGGVAAVTLCLSQTVSKIPTKKGETIWEILNPTYKKTKQKLLLSLIQYQYSHIPSSLYLLPAKSCASSLYSTSTYLFSHIYGYSVHVHICMCGHVHVKAQGWCWQSSSIAPPPYSFKGGPLS